VQSKHARRLVAEIAIGMAPVAPAIKGTARSNAVRRRVAFEFDLDFASAARLLLLHRVFGRIVELLEQPDERISRPFLDSEFIDVEDVSLRCQRL
jgi:hypothetical protein